MASAAAKRRRPHASSMGSSASNASESPTRRSCGDSINLIALWDRIGALLGEFPPKECANFFAAAGYEPD